MRFALSPPWDNGREVVRARTPRKGEAFPHHASQEFAKVTEAIQKEVDRRWQRLLARQRTRRCAGTGDNQRYERCPGTAIARVNCPGIHRHGGHTMRRRRRFYCVVGEGGASLGGAVVEGGFSPVASTPSGFDSG